MDPNAIAGFGNVHYFVAEFLVYAAVSFPHFLIVNGVLQKIMESWPQGFVAKAFVKFFYFSFGKENRVHVIGLQIGGNL